MKQKDDVKLDKINNLDISQNSRIPIFKLKVQGISLILTQSLE